ncbi:MAG: hypothetical protein B6D56_00730 [Candidatus Omnitrophica bacterium 4484_70.1]|nr:MAG: hypothetical protein B6D56_00730 [Candidatus Omnitrophica bacterium 4484_70.1]
MEEKILNYFSLLKKYNRITKAYIIVGENLFSLGLNIAKLINCQKSEYFCDWCNSCLQIEKRNSPDLFILKEEGCIKIDSIRQAQRFLSLRTTNLKNKVLIIDGAEDFLEVAQSAFLKTLEEPPQNSVIILLATRLDNFLPTLVSRCVKIFLPQDFLNRDNFHPFEENLPRTTESHPAFSRKGRGKAVDECISKDPKGIPQSYGCKPVVRGLLDKYLDFTSRQEAKDSFKNLIFFLRNRTIFSLLEKEAMAKNEKEIIFGNKWDTEKLISLWEKSLKIFNDLDNLNIALAKKIVQQELWKK